MRIVWHWGDIKKVCGCVFIAAGLVGLIGYIIVWPWWVGLIIGAIVGILTVTIAQVKWECYHFEFDA